MSLIHDALQHTDANRAAQEEIITAHDHDKNQLYKSNEFKLSTENFILIALVLGGLLSVVYLLYAEYKNISPDLYDDAAVGNNNSVYLGFDDVDSNIDEKSYPDFTLSEFVESETKNMNSNFNSIDAIAGDIAGSINIENISDMAFQNRVKDENIVYLRESPINEEPPILNNNLVSNEAIATTVENNISNAIQEIELVTTNISDLENRAYQYMLAEDYINAQIVLNELISSDAENYYANINLAIIEIKEAKNEAAFRRLLFLQSIYPEKQRINYLIELADIN